MSSQFMEIYPHLSGLDEYSLDVAAWVHETMPEWMQHATVEVFNEHRYLKIELSAPVPMPEAAFQQDLTLETSSQEITVAFGGYHTHFGGLFFQAFGQDSTVEETCAEALAFIEDLMAERKVVTVSPNHWASCHAPDNLEYPSLPDRAAPCYTCSWRGTYNRVYHPDVE